MSLAYAKLLFVLMGVATAAKVRCVASVLERRAAKVRIVSQASQ